MCATCMQHVAVDGCQLEGNPTRLCTVMTYMYFSVLQLRSLGRELTYVKQRARGKVVRPRWIGLDLQGAGRQP